MEWESNVWLDLPLIIIPTFEYFLHFWGQSLESEEGRLLDPYSLLRKRTGFHSIHSETWVWVLGFGRGSPDWAELRVGVGGHFSKVSTAIYSPTLTHFQLREGTAHTDNGTKYEIQLMAAKIIFLLRNLYLFSDLWGFDVVFGIENQKLQLSWFLHCPTCCFYYLVQFLKLTWDCRQ